MKVASILCHVLWIAALQAKETPATPLLDRIISHPGSYSQVCDMMIAETDIPYRAFELTDFSGASFSKANQALIENNRGPLIEAIRARLLELDFTCEAKFPVEDPKPEENNDGDAYGCDPKSLNPLLLGLIRQLQAIETLPELLVVEEKLVKGIAQAKNDTKSPVPVVAGWFVGFQTTNLKNQTDMERDRYSNLFQARVAQRDLVMLMAVLMREKSFGPYLKSSLETAYVQGLKKNAAGYPKYKPGDPLPKEKYGMDFKLDPVTHILRREHDFVSIPYSRESRDEVRAAAARWIAAHP
jgi:hypothetical protein